MTKKFYNENRETKKMWSEKHNGNIEKQTRSGRKKLHISGEAKHVKLWRMGGRRERGGSVKRNTPRT